MLQQSTSASCYSPIPTGTVGVVAGCWPRHPLLCPNDWADNAVAQMQQPGGFRNLIDAVCATSRAKNHFGRGGGQNSAGAQTVLLPIAWSVGVGAALTVTVRSQVATSPLESHFGDDMVRLQRSLLSRCRRPSGPNLAWRPWLGGYSVRRGYYEDSGPYLAGARAALGNPRSPAPVLGPRQSNRSKGFLG